MNYIAKQKRATRLTLIIRLTIAAPQCSIAFFEERATSPKRRRWRMKRGDYVLRGLNGLQSKTHESVLFERSEFTGECAERPTESRKLCTAARHCGGARGETSSLPFLCRRLFSQAEKKCRNAGSIYCLIIVGREGNSQL